VRGAASVPPRTAPAESRSGPPRHGRVCAATAAHIFRGALEYSAPQGVLPYSMTHPCSCVLSARANGSMKVTVVPYPSTLATVTCPS
jgi:hypothetical protein